MTSWIWQPHVVVLFAGTITSLLGALIVWLRRTNPVARYLIRLMLAISIWIFASLLEAGVTDLSTKLFWTQVQYAGLAAMPPYLLLFVLSYTRRDYMITNVLRWGQAVTAVGIQLALATNPWHRQFYTDFSFSPDGVNILVYYHGALYYLSQVLIYTQVGAALLILFNDMIYARPPHRTQLVTMQLAIVLPAAIGVLYTLRMTPLLGLDWTPLAGVIGSLALIWNLYRFQLLTIVPVAYEAVFANVGNAIFVLNNEQQLLDLNPAAERLIGQSAQRVIGQPWSGIWRSWTNDQPLPPCNLPESQAWEIQIGQTPTIKSFALTMFPFVDPAIRMAGRLIVFQEITARKRIEAELRELNGHLEQKVLEQTADLRAAQERLAGQLSEQSRKLAGLYDVILMGGNAERDLCDLLDHALGKVRSIIDCDQLIYLNLNGTALVQQVDYHRVGIAQLRLPPLPVDWFIDASQVRLISSLPHESAVPPELAATGYHTCLVRWVDAEGITGALIALWRQPQPISVEDVALFSALTDELCLILEIEQRRREATRYAVIEERHRLARDLHDSITQSLHSLMLTAENARSVAHSDPQRLDQFLLHLLGSARYALTETRLLLYELRPHQEQQLSLIDMVQIRLESVERRVGIAASVNLKGETPWPAVWEHDLYSLILEALNNALKHAQATEVHIVITSMPDQFTLRIDDNGCGFIPARSSRGGMGMISMAGRSQQLGGVLRIESQQGHGTAIELIIPRSLRETTDSVPTSSFSSVA